MKECKNYRAIKLLCTFYNIFANSVNKMLKNHVKRILGDCQFFFQAERLSTLYVS